MEKLNVAQKLLFDIGSGKVQMHSTSCPTYSITYSMFVIKLLTKMFPNLDNLQTQDILDIVHSYEVHNTYFIVNTLMKMISLFTV